MSAFERLRLRALAAVVLAVALAAGTTAAAAGACVVAPANRYKEGFADTAATRVDDLPDRIVQPFLIDGNGEWVYPEVASKLNQPRTVEGVSSFSTPHRGTDFCVQWTNEDEEVAAVADGTLAATNASWQVAERIDASHVAVFTHTRPLAGMKAGRVVVAGERIARVGAPTENGGYNEHVHFGMTVDAALQVWRPISPFFAGLPGWRGGRDLELLSFPRVDAENRLTVSAYALDGGATGYLYQAVTGVSVFYRKKGATAWTRGEMAVSRRIATGVGNAPIDWSFDLGQAGAAGDAVQWYLAAYRDPDAPVFDDYDIAIESHNYALYPAKYQHPSDVASGYPAGTAPAYATTVLE